MRFLYPLDDLLGSRAKVRILRFLAASPGEHSGREIARRIDMGETPTSRALKSLADTLVVVYRSDGHTHRYRLNRGYALVRETLLPLFEAEARQLDRAVEFLLEGLQDKIQCILVYGSAVRIDQGWASDLDLLVIVPSDEEVAPTQAAMDGRDAAFLDLYGVASPQVFSAGDAARRLRGGEAWIQEALRRGRVVWGSLPTEVEAEAVA
jgi:DNA-binding transcriptional ArsR family regulator